MRLRLLILAFWLCLMVTRAAETNLVEILRRFQAELDAAENSKATLTEQPVQPIPAVPVSAAPRDSGRLLMARDVVQLVVEGEPDMSVARAEVAENGTIQHPVVGAIPVAGKSIEQATAALHELLARDYLVNPRVRLVLLSPGRCSFTIAQEVRKPGTYEWRCEETMTILRAIALAGGPTRKAALSRIMVRRIVEGQSRELVVDLDQLNRDREAKPLALLPGDVVEVPAK
jgi:polysaccharide export outer membrane protein